MTVLNVKKQATDDNWRAPSTNIERTLMTSDHALDKHRQSKAGGVQYLLSELYSFSTIERDLRTRVGGTFGISP